jgi:hypothetical protein
MAVNSSPLSVRLASALAFALAKSDCAGSATGSTMVSK